MASGAYGHLPLNGGYFQGIKVLSSGNLSFPQALYFLLTFHRVYISSLNQPMTFVCLPKARSRGQMVKHYDLCQGLGSVLQSKFPKTQKEQSDILENALFHSLI